MRRTSACSLSGRIEQHRVSVILGALVLVVAGCVNTDEDFEEPTITATVSPAANANGWHNSNVMVTFQCEDNISGIVSCSEPILVDSEGEGQVISGTATDLAGNTASTSVTVNLDRTAVDLSIVSPSDGEMLPNAEVNLVGTVGDALSGVAIVNCKLNGTVDEAVLTDSMTDSDSVFACSIPLDPGTHIITVESSDIAGNVASSLHTVNHTPAPVVTIESPTNIIPLIQPSVTVEGTISDAGASVTVNNVPAVVANGRYSASVSIENGINTITTVARNAAGSGDASIRVLAVIGLIPTVRIASPSGAFVIGGRVAAFPADKPLTLTVTGWVRDNRLVPGSNDVNVTVSFNNEPIDAVLTKESFGLCRLPNRCWTYSAERNFPAPDATNVNIDVTATTGTGGLTRTRSVSGVVDFCYQNNSLGGDGYPEACAASAIQRPGIGVQSRRCIQNADGCSAPLGPLKNDPTFGLLGQGGRGATAFGKDEDENTEEGAFTVFGQMRQNQLPCNRHDECYHQSCPLDGATKVASVVEKDTCNKRFLDNMKAVCRVAYPEVFCPVDRVGLLNCPTWRREKNRCYVMAFVYYEAVSVDTLRYFFSGPYDGWPYNGMFTTCEDCPPVPVD